MPKIEFDSFDSQISAHLVLSGARRPSPAVLLFPAIAGVNDYILSVASRLAANDYAVLILDYYSREGTAPDVSTPDNIAAAVASLPDRRVLADAQSAIAFLRTRPEVNPDRIATLGFCIGGTYSCLTACEGNDLRASIDYYGSVQYSELTQNKPVSPVDRVADLKAPLLGHFGTADRLISRDDVVTFEGALKRHQKPYEFFIYRGAPHAFDEDFRPVYRPVAASEAWLRTLSFLDWYCNKPAR